MPDMLNSFRQQHPAYKDVPDGKLADGLYKKFYASKMSREEFDQKAGLGSAGQDGITGPVSALKNIGQGFNRGIGRVVSGADYAMLGFLDDTPEGQSNRPLGYLAQVLKGEQDIPGTDKRFAHDPTTPGERLLQRGGEVLGESLPAAGVIAAPAKMAMRPATTAVEKGLQTLAAGQASSGALAGEAAGGIGAGVGEELGRMATPESIVGPVVGGLVGGLMPAAATMPMARRAASKMGNAVANYISPQATAARAKAKVLGEIGPHLEGDAVQQRLRQAAGLRKEIEGFDPDLAQATGSEALKESKRDIVRRASGDELETIRAREAGNQAAIKKYAERLAPEGQGGAKAAMEPLVEQREQAARQVRQIEERRAVIPEQKRTQELDIRDKTARRLEQLAERERALPASRDIAETERLAMEELTARTNGARADIAGQVRRIDRAAEGGKIRESIKTERAARKTEIDQMSRELGIDDLQLTTPFRSFARSVKKWRGELLPSKIKNMPDVFDDIDALRSKTSITFDDVKAFRESVVDEVLEATRDSSPGNRKRLANAVRLRQMLDEQVLGFDSLEGGFPDAGQFVDKAEHYASSPDFEDLLQAARFRGGKVKSFETLSDFLTKRGGIQESRGELKSRDIGPRSRPGLYRKKGMSHDDAALAAWEAGYFPDRTMRPSQDDLVNALNDDLSGRPRYKETDMDAAAALNERADVAEDVVNTLEDLGIDWHNASPDEIRARIDEMAQDPIDRSAAADRWKDFRKAYFEKIIEPFERGQVKKTTSKDGTGFYRTLDEEVGLGYLDSADAAEQISRIAKTQPELMASLEAVALDDLASKAVANGVINPRSLERWAESRRGALQHLPKLRQTVNDLVQSVGDVEGKFARGKKIIRERKLGEQGRLANERSIISREKEQARRVASDELRRIGQEASEQKTRLQSAMDPLLERMGEHSERRMALEDMQLARRLAAIASGSTTPAAVIDRAMEQPALMKRLWAATSDLPEARSALQRHVWDGVTDMDGASIQAYMDNNAESLGVAFKPDHLKRVRMIADAKEMADFAPATGQAKPITTNLNEKIREATGMNVSAIAATGAAVSRGRSSKTVEGLRVLFQILTERGRLGYEKLVREALFNPDVAKSMVESAQFGSVRKPNTRLEDFATRRLKGWLWRLGIASPMEEATREEAPAQIDMGQALSDPVQMTRLWTSTGRDQSARRAIRQQAWQGLSEPTGAGVRDYLDKNAKSLRVVFPPDHIKRLGTIADGMSLADGTDPAGKVTRTSIGLAQFREWLAKNDPEGSEYLMRKALANPDLAAAITESIAVKAPKPSASTLDQFATAKLLQHMERLGVAVP